MKYDTKKTGNTEPDTDEKKKITDENFERSDKSAQTGQQGQSDFATGSTTQGGSNYGQGSSNLGPDSYKQGAVKNTGADYENEAGKLSEQKDDAPHGAGANRNEKEANAQEEYPGTKNPDEEDKATDRQQDKNDLEERRYQR